VSCRLDQAADVVGEPELANLSGQQGAHAAKLDQQRVRNGLLHRTDARLVSRVEVRGCRAVRVAAIPAFHAGCTDGLQRLPQSSRREQMLGEQRPHGFVITAWRVKNSTWMSGVLSGR
jgi:hypothetical protein